MKLGGTCELSGLLMLLNCVGYIASNDRMIMDDELKRDVERSGGGLFKVLLNILLEGLRSTKYLIQDKRCSVRDSGMGPSEISALTIKRQC